MPGPECDKCKDCKCGDNCSCCKPGCKVECDCKPGEKCKCNCKCACKCKE